MYKSIFTIKYNMHIPYNTYGNILTAQSHCSVEIFYVYYIDHDLILNSIVSPSLQMKSAMNVTIFKLYNRNDRGKTGQWPIATTAMATKWGRSNKFNQLINQLINHPH